MSWLGAAAALALMAVVLMEAFAVMILPRRVKHIYLARLFYRSAWSCWRSVARLVAPGPWRHAFLGVFGPLSLLILLVVWAVSLIVAFALMHWSLGTNITGVDHDFGTYLYFSGTTFFTLGYGDLVPICGAGRLLSVVEAGLGFGFLAAVLSYLPVVYQAFSRREITISLLDARAGSPPTAGELLRRLAADGGTADIQAFLIEWERWSAELLEGQLSYALLSYYRSQHDNQSWVAALTAILDVTALLIAGVDGPNTYRARLAFATARHAVVDMALVFDVPPSPPRPDRLEEANFARLWAALGEAGLKMRDGPAAVRALAELRQLYEPAVNALAEYFEFALPPFQPDSPPVDNWQTSPWAQPAPGLDGLPSEDFEDHHFN
jgi:hypothetical protein